ncbi:MAG: hypothetical protein ACYSR6_05755 [Planctomycetota bacterium]|jgi:hypothetical protein
MKSKLTKAIIIIVLFIGIGIAYFYISAVKSWRDFYARFSYKESTPEQVIRNVERFLDVNFPEHIENARAVTARNWDSSAIRILIKFTAHPNEVDKFLKSLGRSYKLELEPYRHYPDERSFGSSTPKWFTEAIRAGKEVDVDLSPLGNPYVIYIDESNKDHSIVYMAGHYYPGERIKNYLK